MKTNVNPSTMPLFNVQRYMGKWYEYAKLPLVYERNCDSATARYTPNKDGTITVLNKCFFRGNEMQRRKGKAYLEEEHYYDPAKLTVSFEGQDAMPPAPYWVHWTDYDNFAIVGGPSGQFVWILTRRKSISRYESDCLINYLTLLGYDIFKDGDRLKLIFSDYVRITE